ncbi:hypothetical protein GPJ59_12115, partial [Streptomyces bambusae]|nr:hypothetical protein [Streptomyces bambusae]
LYSMGLLPGTGGKSGAQAEGSSTRPPAASGSDAATPRPTPSGSSTGQPPSRDSVPKELVGTWKGSVTSNLGLPSTFEITIREGRKGEVVGRDKSVLNLFGTEYDCSGDWKLASATDRSLVLDTVGGTNPHPGICSNGSADERFTLNEGGTLHYRSGDRAAGNPEGDLTRSP